MPRYSPDIIRTARQKYVFECHNLHQISALMGITVRTLQRWKSDAGTHGDNWDTARNNSIMATGGRDAIDQLVCEFVTMFNQTLDELKSDTQLSATHKVNLIASLGDAYTKVIKSAGKTDPEKTRLGIALDTIQALIEYLSANDAIDAIEILSPHLESFGKHYSQKIKAT